ncbi:MAG TPA: hypothetical protein VF832_08635 [Longimicrobiales bacterium]
MSSPARRRKPRYSGPMAPLPPWMLAVLLLAVLFAIWYLLHLQ